MYLHVCLCLCALAGLHKGVAVRGGFTGVLSFLHVAHWDWAEVPAWWHALYSLGRLDSPFFTLLLTVPQTALPWLSPTSTAPLLLPSSQITGPFMPSDSPLREHSVHVWRDEDNLRGGVELRLLDLAASSFTCWAILLATLRLLIKSVFCQWEKTCDVFCFPHYYLLSPSSPLISFLPLQSFPSIFSYTLCISIHTPHPRENML